MNVLFFVVNFKADEHLVRLLLSVAAAQALCPLACIDVHVLDNSEKPASEMEQLRARLGVAGVLATQHSLGTNDGYFGGLGLAKSLVSEKTDCVIYCNPDVLLDPDFFVVLQRTLMHGAGVVAPAIVSIENGVDQNPKYRQRLSEGKLRRLQRIYAHRLLYVTFNMLSRVKEVAAGWRRRPATAD